MKKKRILRNLIFFGGITGFLLSPLCSYGQTVKRQSISSYGSSSSTAEVYISQTGGQCYNTINKNQGKAIVMQGFQQSSNFVLKIAEHIDPNNLNMDLYPNPATQAVTITSNKPMEGYHINLIDSRGKILLSEKINGLSQYKVNCELYSNGIYFIRVFNSNQDSQTLKLVISK
ncbi:MAG: T9SS type A sorting domain-containing protein [Bacteroidales bacterium]|nr:T9SS type A sorting domain-containing protein [Bacteroidales bacterium]